MLRAHPAGTTEVLLTVRPDRTFEVAITIDADALRAKQAAMQRPLSALVDVRFDGVHATASSAGSVDSAGMTTVRLVGAIPARVSRVTLQTKLVYGSYALTIQPAGGPPLMQWVQGFDASAPVPIDTDQPAGSDGHLLGYVAGAFALAGLVRVIERLV